jgi:hypothetical protein
MSGAIQQQGVLRVVSPGGVSAAMDQQAKERASANTPITDELQTGLAGHIKTEFEMFRMHRDSAPGWSERMLAAMRSFNGQYDAGKLAEIQKFGGSQVYARVIAMKCRGASSLLRDVYLGPDRPWGLAASPDPDIPESITQAIRQLITSELSTLQQSGQPIDPSMVRDRVNGLMEAARDAAKKRARKQSKIAEDKLDEILQEGGFYKAFAEFLVDLPLVPVRLHQGPGGQDRPGSGLVLGHSEDRPEAQAVLESCVTIRPLVDPGRE